MATKPKHSSAGKPQAKKADAIALLKADHRQIEAQAA
jgi:hypothetical protein